MGSSPRMRGSLNDIPQPHDGIGIIPAHAGLTMRHHFKQCCSQDHPRACGAHRTQRRVEDTELGSSPRMRGSHSEGVHRLLDIGIIPAHAGLTPLATSPPAHGWDHPRACGAHTTPSERGDKMAGSSPRMRGSH